MLQAVYFYPFMSVKYIDQVAIKSQHTPTLISELCTLLGHTDENKHLVTY